MMSKTDVFHQNRLYRFLTDSTTYSFDTLDQLNQLLHEDPELAELTHPKDGSYLHLICQQSKNQEKIVFRMIYALSNAGADPNMINDKGNTPLHEVLNQDEIDLDIVQALFRIGVDPRIVNHLGKRAEDFLKANVALVGLLQGYGQSMWTAIETGNIEETQRLIQGFIKIDCKHNTNKTLLDKARDLNNDSILQLLAEYQATNEFVHSILACDWDRAELISEYQNKNLKFNAADPIHRFTSFQSKYRSCSKSLLEICLDTRSVEGWKIIFRSPSNSIDVNILGSDGLPIFFHCFDSQVDDFVRMKLLTHANLFTKSFQGETFLFHLIHLYSNENNEKYFQLFRTIIYLHPLLLTQRNNRNRTIIDELNLVASTTIFNRFQIFKQIITNLCIRLLNNYSIIERMILNGFAGHLWIILRNKHLPMTKNVFSLLSSIKGSRGLIHQMKEFQQALIDDDLNKFHLMLKKKSNLYLIRDAAGRSCAHLAVLYQRYNFLKFLCENYPRVMKIRDNSNRTVLHYATILNDQTSIDLLQQFPFDQLTDCFNITAREYLQRLDVHCDEFNSKNFFETQNERLASTRSDFIKVAFYPTVKKHIENDSIKEFKFLQQEMIDMGFDLKDFPLNSSLEDFCHGENYVPLLFLIIEHRSLTILQYFRELQLPMTGRMLIKPSEISKKFPFYSKQFQDDEFQWVEIDDLLQHFHGDLLAQRPVTVEIPSNPDEKDQTNQFSRVHRQLKLFFGRNAAK